MNNVRKYGEPPCKIAVVHGGPGAGGEMAPVARELASEHGVLELLQTATSLQGQIEELQAVLLSHATLPVTLIGFSWGAWLAFLIAAQQSAIIKKLILIGSGPFEQAYVEKLQQNRIGRLNEHENIEWNSIIKRLADPAAGDIDALLDRLRALASKTDAYDPVEELAQEGLLQSRSEIFRHVWHEAAELRRSGELLKRGAVIDCPVVAIHGDYDPHPFEGVQIPLAAVLKDFRAILLTQCGHKPWVERMARTRFFQLLKDEL
ncbi:alpha/beta hydrolase [candidate division KSB1 bacterium]|nr:alpha/beta hydrolase [candidate division KSB1 bacterium]